MKRNGQALVEFIIILPILIILLLGIVDFGLIFYEKNVLENTIDEVCDMWEDEESILKIEDFLGQIDDDINFNYTSSKDTIKLELVSIYNPITPGLDKILNEVKVNRVIYNE